MEQIFYELKTQFNLYNFIEEHKEELQDAYIAIRHGDIGEKIISASFLSLKINRCICVKM